MPRLFVKKTGKLRPVYQIGYGWDLPLLEINAWFLDPTVSAVRRALSNLVAGGALDNHRLCPHVTAEKEMQEFIQASICKCFIRRRHFKYEDRFGTCECQRQVNLQCPVCGAVYTWLRYGGQVLLSFRYIWTVQRPTSPGWLNLVDKSSIERLFTPDNRHILWCDTPSCRTNTRGRWEALVKEDLEREYHKSPNVDEHEFFDYREAKIASQDGAFQNW
jgi:hypothetical protein